MCRRNLCILQRFLNKIDDARKIPGAANPRIPTHAPRAVVK